MGRVKSGDGKRIVKREEGGTELVKVGRGGEREQAWAVGGRSM